MPPTTTRSTIAALSAGLQGVCRPCDVNRRRAIRLWHVVGFRSRGEVLADPNLPIGTACLVLAAGLTEFSRGGDGRVSRARQLSAAQHLCRRLRQPGFRLFAVADPGRDTASRGTGFARRGCMGSTNDRNGRWHTENQHRVAVSLNQTSRKGERWRSLPARLRGCAPSPCSRASRDIGRPEGARRIGFQRRR